MTRTDPSADGGLDIAVTTLGISAGVIDGQAVRRAVAAALARQGCRWATVSVALADDRRISALAARFLRQHGPTDVLSFPLNEESPHGPLDGELVVSVETAQREAARRGHPLEAEVALYAVHGTLHLLGLDDDTSPAAARMHELEDEILSGLGYGRVFDSGSPDDVDGR